MLNNLPVLTTFLPQNRPNNRKNQRTRRTYTTTCPAENFKFNFLPARSPAVHF